MCFYDLGGAHYASGDSRKQVRVHLNEEELRKSSPKTRGNVQLGPGQVRTDQYRGESWV